MTPVAGDVRIPAVPTFLAADGLELAYHAQGEGRPLICIPGGPMRDSRYFGDLGGLSATRCLVRLDLAGTGQSAVAGDASRYRCDRLVADVRALQDHLGLERSDLLGHSAGANLAVLYAAQYPERVRSLVLVGPSTRAVGMDASSEMRREILQLRHAEPWFAAASAAFERVQAGEGTDADWDAMSPLVYGRWDAAAQASAAAQDLEMNIEAAQAFGAPGAFDPSATRAALATFDSPVLVLAGEWDINTPPRLAADVAALFPSATFVIQPGAGHTLPWLDDAAAFTSTVSAFLA
jgi:proline iminopeptidase